MSFKIDSTSPLHRRYTQCPPFAYYIVENNGGNILKTLVLGDTQSLNKFDNIECCIDHIFIIYFISLTSSLQIFKLYFS